MQDIPTLHVVMGKQLQETFYNFAIQNRIFRQSRKKLCSGQSLECLSIHSKTNYTNAKHET